MIIQVDVEVSEKDMMDLLCGAFEGGSRYWARMEMSKNAEPSEITRVYDLFAMEDKHVYPFFLPFAGGEYKVIDVEENLPLGLLNKEALERGMKLLASGKDKNGKVVPIRHWRNFVDEMHDAETSDVYLQLCVMGEIVFG